MASLSLLPLDVGFDIKALKMQVDLPPGIKSVGYLDKAGEGAAVCGSRATIRRILYEAGYVLVGQLVCLRCGWSWEQRGKEKPVTCPGCKSPYWETPRSLPVAPPIHVDLSDIGKAIGALEALKADIELGNYKLRSTKAEFGAQKLKIEVSWV